VTSNRLSIYQRFQPLYESRPSNSTSTHISNITAATGKIITKVSIGSAADVDKAVAAARTAFKTTWGLNCPGTVRGQLMNKFTDLLEKHIDEFAGLDALDNGQLRRLVSPLIPSLC
jgi:acyl-CoA reductase-like NAD-dependent aldehyde dehydrogenase